MSPMNAPLRRDVPWRPIAPLFLAVFLHTAGASAHDAAARPDDAEIAVSGSAESSHEPDRVNIRFGVEVRRPTSREALSANSDLMERVVQALRDAGIGEDEISTSRFDIHAIYDNRPDRDTGGRTQVLTGYQVSNIVLVDTAALGSIGTLIDAAVAAGVNRVEGVQFTLSPELHAKLKDRLIGDAVLDARARAERALAPLGYAITGVKSVSLSDFAVPSPRFADVGRLEMAQAAPTQIFASDQQVRVSVQVTFLIGAAPEEN